MSGILFLIKYVIYISIFLNKCPSGPTVAPWAWDAEVPGSTPVRSN